MRTLKQIIAITWMNLQNIPSRLGASLVIVIGIAGVVAVLVALLSMAQGFAKTLVATGADDRAMLLSAGVSSELSSSISRDQIPLLREYEGVQRDADGKPLASAELVVITELQRGEGDRLTDVNVSMRGVEPAGFKIRKEVQIIEGRMFEPGLREIIAGKGAREQFGATVGKVLQFRGSEWTVVGIFESGGDAHESEIWADADTARSAFNRSGASSMLLQLASPEALEPFKQLLAADPQMQLDVYSEHEYYSSQSENFVKRIGVLAGVVTFIMAIGALFGALNTMYSAVSTRSVEIATLRAIGFGGLPVVCSVLTEAVVLSVFGGLLGAAIAYLLFNGMTVSTLGQGFTQVAFAFTVGPELLSRGLFWAVAIGLIGGFFPAIKAARLPVIEALRAG